MILTQTLSLVECCAVTLGVFCIESWSSDLRVRSTVRPLLSFLESTGDINVIHQRVKDRNELLDYLGVWSRYDTYPFGFLAMHGARGEVVAGAECVTIEELVDATLDGDDEEWSLDLQGKVLYLGGCSTFRTDSGRLERLKSNTGARVICGYERAVDWYRAASFEVLLLSSLARQPNRVSDALRRLAKRYPDHIKELGFRTVPDYSDSAKAR